MKKIILLLGIVFWMSASALSQTKHVKYTYDASGNRIKREMIPVTLKNEKAATEEDFAPIEETWGERQVTIFPNPTRGNLKIQIEGGEDEAEYIYQLYNSAGALVLNGRIESKGEYPLPMEALSPGVYILTLISHDEKLTYKIIKE